MALDFSIVEIDIYRDLNTQSAKELCIKYNVKLSENSELDKLAELIELIE